MGEAPNPSYRLVVARFGENLDWVDAFDNYTIYNKGKDDLEERHRARSLRLPNVGREAHSYIHHIIENYDRLEDVLIFCQGKYLPHVKCDPQEFLRRVLDVGDVGFGYKLDRRGHIGSNARDFILHEYGGPLKTKKPYNLGGWWESTTGEPYVRSRSVFWNSIFSVRKEFVLKRSRESYRRILETLEWSVNPMEGHFCERSWFNILNLPVNYEMEVNHDPPPPPASPLIDKDVSFDVARLIERWESRKGDKPKSKITVRFRPAIGDVPSSPILSREELLGFLENSHDLMSRDTETVMKCASALRYNIEGWTKANCPGYPLDKPFVSKDDLEDKSGWYAPAVAFESMEVGTTGSTTGYSFKYMRWHPAFNKIEWDYHYDLVLDEFGVRNDPHVLYFFSEHYSVDGDAPIACFGGPSALNMNNHGSKRSPVVHYANFGVYQKDPEGFFRFLFDYVKERQIDVFFTSPPQVSSMCNYIRKTGVTHRIGGLLSSTGDKILPADAHFLFVKNSYFDDVCDHMRCWDGGATFYTCKHRNYHLMDNLCWVEEIDGRMVCTDYFNLASPFVRYWNGDFCRIGKEYRRCECGRLYREFEFVESRPFSLKGVCMRQIKEGLRALDIPGIKEVRCCANHLDIVSTKPIPQGDRRRIASLTDRFAFRFVVEEHHS